MVWLGRAARFLLPYGAVVVSRGLDCLYILQVERYKPDRFRAWVVSHRRMLVPGRECILQSLTVAAAVSLAKAGQHWLASVIVWLLTGHLILSRHQSLQVSQRHGSTLDVADTQENAAAFGRPGASRGRSAYPQIRFVSLVENGTHVLFGTQVGEYATGELSLAKGTLKYMKAGMLCLADRYFFGFDLWNQARQNGADLLWRVKKNLRLPVEERLEDGSYLSRIYPTQKDQRRRRNGVSVRVIEYQLNGVPGAEPIYRLLTTILEPIKAPAQHLP